MANFKRPYFSKGKVRSLGGSTNFEPRDIPLDGRMQYSFGQAVPRNGLMACLCEDKNTYSRKCCKGYLINQGIGPMQGPGTREEESPWNAAFSNAFGPLYQ